MKRHNNDKITPLKFQHECLLFAPKLLILINEIAFYKLYLSHETRMLSEQAIEV